MACEEIRMVMEDVEAIKEANNEHQLITRSPASQAAALILKKYSVPDGPKNSRIHRVPQEVRLNKKRSQQLFDPMVVSMGPYHHGEPYLALSEKLKEDLLRIFLQKRDYEKGFFYNPIMERIDEIRDCYVGVSKDDYNDAALTDMMLRDGVFLTMYHMALDMQPVVHQLGWSRLAFLARDIYLIENQIPYSVIKLLTRLTFGNDKGDALVLKFLSTFAFGDDGRLKKFPWEDREDFQEPLHLVEAIRITFLWENKEKKSQSCSSSDPCVDDRRWPSDAYTGFEFHRVSNPFRSVTELSAKGIHIVASSNCHTDITFTSYACCGVLRLPIWIVTYNSKVLYANLIALEMSLSDSYPLNNKEVTSYVSFMKSLIESSKDVKMLRERGILFSVLGNEEVVQLFKDVEITGMRYSSEKVEQVKRRIDEHCNNRGKTWMADLYHTYFKSPWAVIALFATASILFLTFSQTYLALLSYRRDNQKH